MSLGLLRGTLGFSPQNIVYFMMSLFTKVGNALDRVITLAEPDMEVVGERPDRLSVGGTQSSVTVDQNSVTAAVAGAITGELLLSSVDIPGDKRTQGEKFFVIYHGEWNASKGNLDEITHIDIWEQLIDADHSVKGLIEYHALARFGVEIMVQINPTSFQAGGILAAMVPVAVENCSLASFTLFPHALLNCNINNVGRVLVPWVYTRGALKCSDPLYTPWVLYLIVWSKLRCATSTSQSVSITVLARFVDLQLHGMKPISTMYKPAVRQTASSRVFAVNNRFVASAEFHAGLGDDHCRTDPTVAGGTKIQDFRVWVETPTLVWQTKVNIQDSVGTVLCNLPVNPYWYGLTYNGAVNGVSSTQSATTSLSAIASMYAYWRGDITYHVQIFPTRYHSGRILACFVPGDENTSVSTMNIRKASTCMCAVMDITGTSSTLCFRVPWVSETPYKVNTNITSHAFVGRSSSTGRFLLMVYNTVKCPSNVYADVLINIYVSGTNMEFMAPVMCFTTHRSQAGDDVLGEAKDTAVNTAGYTEQHPILKVDSLPRFPGEVEPQRGVQTSIEDPILAKQKPQTFPERDAGVSRHVVDHLKITEFMGRGMYYAYFTMTNNDSMRYIPIQFASTSGQHIGPGTWQWFNNLYHLIRGPIDCSVYVAGEGGGIELSVFFLPYGVFSSDSSPSDDILTSSKDFFQDEKTTVGVFRFNTKYTQACQFRIPWYHNCVALSPAVQHKCKDYILGHLGFQISWLSGGETVGISIYLSVNDETEIYFPRPPACATFLSKATARSLADPRQAAIESSVDEIEDEQDKEFRELVEKYPEKHPKTLLAEFEKEKKPYKKLRMVVGAHRLANAFEDLKKSKSTSELFSQGGHHWNDGTVVQSKRQGEQLQGFYFDGAIYFAERVGSKGRFAKTEITDGWVETGTVISPTNAENWALEDFWAGMRFSWSKFQKSEKIKAFESQDWDMLQQRCNTSGLTQLLSVFSISRSVVDKIVDGSEIGTKVKDVVSDVSQLTQECSKFLEDLKKSMEKLARAVSRSKIGLVIKILLEIGKLAMTVYLCHKLGWDSETVGIALGILSLEIMSITTDLCVSVSHAFSEVMSVIVTKTDDLETQSLGWMRSVVAGIVIFKNVRSAFVWLVEKLEGWLQAKAGDELKIVEALEDCQDDVESLLEEVEEFIICRKLGPSDLTKGLSYARRLRTLMSLTSKLKVGTPVVIKDMLGRLVSTMQNIEKDTGVVVRPEPVVLYAHGEKGQGKSLLCMALAVKICTYYGVDYTDNIYTKPVDSDYWDGYDGQLVCIMDDIGQNTDDHDWSSFCQLVSTTPFRLNMAHLHEKGKYFTSPFIICSSNVSEPNPKTVYCAEAVERRLHFKVRVGAREPYKLKNGCLDMEKAERQGVLADLSCLHMMSGEDEYSLNDLVDLMTDTVQDKTERLERLMELWSQSETSLSVALKRLFQASCKYSQMRLGMLWDSIKKNKFSILAAVLGVLSAAGLVFGIYKAVSSKEAKQESGGAYDGMPRPKNVVRLGESPEETQSVLELSGVVHRNLVRVGVGNDDEYIQWRVNGIGIKDDWMLVPAHALEFDVDDFSKLFFHRNGTFYSCDKSKVEILSLETGFQDVLAIRVPGMPKFRNIEDHFVSERDLDRCDGHIATLCTMNGGIYQMISEGTLKLVDRSDYLHRMDDGSTKQLHIGKSWRGRGETLPGSCGGILVSSNNKLQNPLIGMHVAAGGGNLISKVITKEMLSVMGKHLTQSGRIKMVEVSDIVVPVGAKTRFLKSPIHDSVKHLTNKVPAALPYQQSHEVDPVSVMLSKFDAVDCDEPPDYGQVSEFVLDVFKQEIGQVDGFLDSRSAIKGIEGLDAIPMNTSAGFPYVLKNLRKEDLVDVEGNITHELCASRLAYILDKFDAGECVDIDYIMAAKDELRPKAKVLLSKTRAIECCPFDFNIFVRMVLGRVAAKFYSKPGLRSHIAIGIFPEDDWHPLFTSLVRFAEFGVDLDFQNFDGTVSKFMISRAVAVLCGLTPLDELRTSVLQRYYTQTRLRMRDHIFHIEGGMQSGAPCTSLINSVINVTNLFWALQRMTGWSLPAIRENYRIIVYGDDVMMAPKRGISVPRIDLLQGLFDGLGMKCTAGDKGCVRLVKVLDLTFLKRVVKIDEDGRIKACLDPESIWGMLAWRREGADFGVNVDTASWYAFQHGKIFYETFSAVLSDALRLNSRNERVPSYLFWKLFSVDYTGVRDVGWD
ncbi:polyprotein [crahelivirus A1]|uniref:Genome polyprotein n=1 Tax=crahelivirus A1 TaxID=2870357 RepID=A0A2K9YN85_9PICO|nr:polyprotein [Picornaviridae sp.]AUW34301.1 polyprotein [crahelivirus A1]